MKKDKNKITIQDIGEELDSIIADVDKPKTKADLHKWLIRIYKAAAKLAVIQEGFTQRPSLNPIQRKNERELLKEIPASLETLNILAQKAVTELNLKEKR